MAANLATGYREPDAGKGTATGRPRKLWAVLAAVEVALAVAAVMLDLGIPTFVILG
jgi:hypothetical protein